MTDKHYRVQASDTSLRFLKKLFNVDHVKVLNRSEILLSQNPYEQAEGVANFPGFEFNDRHWTLIRNVIVLYRVSDEKRRCL
jgi:hypothetical protein